MMMTDGNGPCVDFLRFAIAAYRSKETDIDEVAPVTELPRITLSRMDRFVSYQMWSMFGDLQVS